MSKVVRKATPILLGFLISLALILAFFNVPMAQTSSQITVYKEVGSANLKAPGTESFWSKIPWTNISLTANIPNAPTSGLTKYVLVKAAWNGTDIIILLKWYAPNPAFNAWSAAAAALYPPASGPGLFRIIEITPGAKYTVNDNATFANYTSIVNGKTVSGRIFLSYDGISVGLPNDSQIEVLSNGTILLYHSLRPMERILYESGLFYGYYTNSTWYYPDRAAMMWYMGSGTPSMDGMHIGGKYPGQVFDGENFTYAGGALKQPGGAANIWMWVSGATWNNATYDPAFKVNLWENESLTGLPYTDPNDDGFAVPLYTNNTNMYEVDTAGIWYAPVQSSGLNGSLFFIKTGATYQNGYWTLEFVRPLAVPSSYAKYMPNITTGTTYYVAFAIWQGPLGETLFDKSITSAFLQLQLSTESSPPPPPVLTIPPTVADTTIAGVVIAIVALIVIYVMYRK
ncbi:cytochrome b558/566 subunit A [Acidianus sulfidivorans JP7]|uniref:Cytochrome b558/566 subunit A n=1 Tax=Acidianus sulfidivorans JP7 TaxID=619593 RepID=A0A2U9IPM5_9CREN|nr:cytochrome b558/566 subunit A [Acidianus sulfidivorans]AWR97953.1 cytochrome b558/566 subunit A [Acidianus sulfidivorans JP7]